MSVVIGQMRKSVKLDRERYYVILSIEKMVRPDVYLLNVWDSWEATERESSLYLNMWTVPVDNAKSG